MLKSLAKEANAVIEEESNVPEGSKKPDGFLPEGNSGPNESSKPAVISAEKTHFIEKTLDNHHVEQPDNDRNAFDILR